MKRILFIDPVSHRSHANFNALQINALKKVCDVSCVFRQGYSLLLGNPSIRMAFEIPNLLYKNTGNGLRTRFYYLKVLLFLKCNIDFSNYDAVIFSYYEEISFFFARMPKGFFLFNHINVAGLHSKIKRWFYYRISQSHTQLVFNENMRNYLLSIGVTNVEIVPHGLIQKYEMPDASAIKEICVNLDIYDKILFMPSATSANQSFLEELLASKQFNEYLSKRNYLLIVKGNYSSPMCRNILVLRNFLSDECYKLLLLRSDIIVLAYHKDFINRVSGILFECISNNKNIVMSEVDGLLAYKDLFSDYPYYSTIDSLISKIDYYDTHGTIYKREFDKEILEPNYERILALL